MTEYSILLGKWLENPKFKAEYDRLGPIYEFVGASKDDLRRYDSANYLKTEGEMSAFLEAVIAEAGDDVAFMSWAVDVVARAYQRLDYPRDGVLDNIKVFADSVRRIAKDAGAADGFTDRLIPKPVLREPTVQINAKVPADFRDRFMAALAEETARNRAVRSIGDFLMVIFEEWEARRPGAA